jgi:hypothetical protein
MRQVAQHATFRPVSRTRDGNPSSPSGPDRRKYQWRVMRELEHQALGPAVYYFTTYALRGVVKFMR